MTHAFADIAFTPSVRRAQEQDGTRQQGAGADAGEPAVNHRLGGEEAAFIAAQRSFYMATVSETGWPYVQHRGGPPGFLKVLDESTLAFADFAGNRQLISVGNLSVNDKVALILVDYTHRRRLKILGTLSVHPLAPDSEEFRRLAVPGYRARPQRAVTIKVAAFDWNCPQHIPVRFEAADVQRELAARDARIAELERLVAEAPPTLPSR